MRKVAQVNMHAVFAEKLKLTQKKNMPETTNDQPQPAPTADKYIGPFKVLGIKKVEEMKTPAGAEIVSVIFEAGSSNQLMPLATYEALLTDKPTDLTDLGDRRVNLVRDSIINAILEHDLTALEIQAVVNKVSNKISNVYDRVGHYLFTKAVYGAGRDNTWVPGSNYTHYRSLLECQAVFKQMEKETQDGRLEETSDK